MCLHHNITHYDEVRWQHEGLLRKMNFQDVNCCHILESQRQFNIKVDNYIIAESLEQCNKKVLTRVT